MDLDEQLQAAYEMAEYRLLQPPLSIYIEQVNTALITLLQEQQTETVSIITAFNPQSASLSDEENNRQQSVLHQHLEGLGQPYLHGLNIDPTGVWPPEPTYWVFGLSAAEAIELGNLFRQKAIVQAQLDGIPKLFFCPS